MTLAVGLGNRSRVLAAASTLQAVIDRSAGNGESNHSTRDTGTLHTKPARSRCQPNAVERASLNSQPHGTVYGIEGNSVRFRRQVRRPSTNCCVIAAHVLIHISPRVTNLLKTLCTSHQAHEMLDAMLSLSFYVFLSRAYDHCNRKKHK